jgi:hypothetical protein
MRARTLLELFQHSLGYAINLGHERIELDDITPGLLTYAHDFVIAVNQN